MLEIRCIIDPPLAGASNMARDEGLLARVGRGASSPTLRFYQWDPPTISLGYFQPYADYEQLAPPAGELAVVRRTTGGGAILHDRELTYSLTVPLGHRLLAGGTHGLYAVVHDALIDALGTRGVTAAPSGRGDGSGPAKGPFFCFARRHSLDVLVDGEKLAGSAQRRTTRAVLQHGSAVLERRFTQQPAAALDRLVPFTAGWLAGAWSASLSKRTGISIIEGTWHAEELQEAQTFIDKYAGAEWTRRR